MINVVFIYIMNIVKSTDTGSPNIPKYEQFFLVKGELLRLPPPSQNRCESYRSPKISYKSFLELMIIEKHTHTHNNNRISHTDIPKRWAHNDIPKRWSQP